MLKAELSAAGRCGRVRWLYVPQRLLTKHQYTLSTLTFRLGILPAFDFTYRVHREGRFLLIGLLVLSTMSLEGCTFARIAMRNVPPSFRKPASVQKLNRSDIPSGTRLSATWIGHSTVLIQMDDVYVLTDPILTQRVGMVSKRLVQPGMDLEKIPALNVVLISHRHFDHLSPASLACSEIGYTPSSRLRT